MSVITDVERWGNSHRPGFLDIFGLFWGASLLTKDSTL